MSSSRGSSHPRIEPVSRWQAASLPLASLVAQMVKHLLAMQETRVRSLGREGLLEKDMATHSRMAKSRTGLSDFTFFSPGKPKRVVISK